MEITAQLIRLMATGARILVAQKLETYHYLRIPRSYYHPLPPPSLPPPPPRAALVSPGILSGCVEEQNGGSTSFK